MKNIVTYHGHKWQCHKSPRFFTHNWVFINNDKGVMFQLPLYSNTKLHVCKTSATAPPGLSSSFIIVLGRASVTQAWDYTTQRSFLKKCKMQQTATENLAQAFSKYLVVQHIFTFLIGLQKGQKTWQRLKLYLRNDSPLAIRWGLQEGQALSTGQVLDSPRSHISGTV